MTHRFAILDSPNIANSTANQHLTLRLWRARPTPHPISMSTSALARLPASGAPDLLYLLFHDAGANAEQMTALAQALAAQYPQAAVLCVHAPDGFDGDRAAAASAAPTAADARQWFSAPGLGADPSLLGSRVAAALAHFIAVLRGLQQRFGIGWERTALAGFGQGATMVLEAVQAEPQLAGRVLAFAGRHVDLPDHAPADTSVHLFHGQDDAVVSYRASVESARALVGLGADVTADVLPDIGHELDPALIDAAIHQLRTFLPQKVWREAMKAAPTT